MKKLIIAFTAGLLFLPVSSALAGETMAGETINETAKVKTGESKILQFQDLRDVFGLPTTRTQAKSTGEPAFKYNGPREAFRINGIM